ncbi:MAG: lasso peptide biosynthesis B2 protein, partial [Planctomycetes bacterium]|nr:lasso peptide biosynthesis B2 protein [Planctomycetota bacterium]
MRRLSRFLALPSGERAILVHAALLLAALRAVPAWFGFGRIRAVLAFLASRRRVFRRRVRVPEERIAWAVSAAGRRLPGTTSCLAEALAAQVLLAREGHRARLEIGVARGEGESLAAHAWVECGGQILLGTPEPGFRYTTLRPPGKDPGAAFASRTPCTGGGRGEASEASR